MVTQPTQPTQSTQQTLETRRRRGGQPGNQNARTHGYYSNNLTLGQCKALRSATFLEETDRDLAVLLLKISSIMTKDPDNYRVLNHALSRLGRIFATARQPDGTLRYPEAIQALITMAGACPEQGRRGRS